jgi:hypothetical protein
MFVLREGCRRQRWLASAGLQTLLFQKSGQSPIPRAVEQKAAQRLKLLAFIGITQTANDSVLSCH